MRGLPGGKSQHTKTLMLSDLVDAWKGLSSKKHHNVCQGGATEGKGKGYKLRIPADRMRQLW